MSTRLGLIQDHLISKFPKIDLDNSLDEYRKESLFLNKDLILKHYIGSFHPKYLEIRKLMSSNSLFNHNQDEQLSVSELRSRVLDQIKVIYESFPSSVESDIKNPLEKFNVLYTLSEYDSQVSIRLIVSLVLYVDAITYLGTEKHRELLERAYSLKDIGCIALTELGRGSNVSDLETIASYDKVTNEFILSSLTPTSTKWWIPGVQTANMVVVFAQLIFGNINFGVHAFAVPIRDPSKNLFQGITVGDCGKKISLNGMDNGFIIFNNYRVPYSSLLDKYSKINSKRFKSSIENKEKRTAVMLGALTRGKLCGISGSESHLKSALAIALRYSALRKQFSSGDGPEVSILTYQMQKFKLIPLLAQTFAIRAGVLYLAEFFKSHREKFVKEPDCEEFSEFHAILSSFKALSNWYSIKGIQLCRESCGGLGYSKFSAIGRIRANQDINLTWEGDNYILLQQTSKYLIKQVQKVMKAQKNNSETLKFLKLSSLDPKKLKEITEFTKENIFEILELEINYLLQKTLLKLQENAIIFNNVNYAWNNTQTFYLSDLAQSYGDYLLTKNLYEMAGKVESDCKVTGDSIKSLAKLFGLNAIEKKISNLMEMGFGSTFTKLLRNNIIDLCENIGKISVGIIDAIAPNDVCLGSAIGNSDGQAYAHMIQAVESHPNVYRTSDWIQNFKKHEI
jgi:acyl-CoA oxidase